MGSDTAVSERLIFVFCGLLTDSKWWLAVVNTVMNLWAA